MICGFKTAAGSRARQEGEAQSRNHRAPAGTRGPSGSRRTSSGMRHAIGYLVAVGTRADPVGVGMALGHYLQPGIPAEGLTDEGLYAEVDPADHFSASTVLVASRIIRRQSFLPPSTALGAANTIGKSPGFNARATADFQGPSCWRGRGINCLVRACAYNGNFGDVDGWKGGKCGPRVVGCEPNSSSDCPCHSTFDTF